jgi:hypothetical protein
VCGPNERYLSQTLDEFARLCDEVSICLCNADPATEAAVEARGFKTRRDDREWGLYQNRIKEDHVASLAALEPEWLVCLDMDETFDPTFTRDDFDRYASMCDAMYVYIVNLWDGGWNRAWSFWNVRAWKWSGDTRFANRPLHCGLAPEWAYHYGSHVPVALLHYGLKDADVRAAKVARYERYDPEAKYRDRSYYDALSNGTSQPLDLPSVRVSLAKEITSVRRKKGENVVREFANVRRQDGVVLNIPLAHLSDHIRRGFTLVS